MNTIKLLTTVFILILVASCSKESSSCNNISNGELFEFKEGDVFCINDFELEITEVIDERCPCFANCIWAGEFKFTLNIIDDTDTTLYIHHAESEITVPDPSPLGLSFSDVTLHSDDSCEDPIVLGDLIFEMTIN